MAGSIDLVVCHVVFQYSGALAQHFRLLFWVTRCSANSYPVNNYPVYHNRATVPTDGILSAVHTLVATGLAGIIQVRSAT